VNAGSVRVDTVGAVATITLDRPAQRNALTPGMLGELRAAIGAVGPTARCLVLAGEGKVFCAGFDLDLCRASPDGEVMRALLTGLSRAVTALRALPIPVVAAAQGAAIAGGCALLGGADIIIADRGAKFGYPVVRLGISPAVSAPTISGLIGRGRARERMLDTALIDGVEARRIGLVHELVDEAGDVGGRARVIAEELAAKPPGAMSVTRSWLREIEGLGPWPDRALAASLALTGSEEERVRLAEARRA
jgi:enoyl-CoA hydratase/carnithine racemase